MRYDLLNKKAPNVDRTQAASKPPQSCPVDANRSNACRMAARDATGQLQAAEWARMSMSRVFPSMLMTLARLFATSKNCQVVGARIVRVASDASWHPNDGVVD